MTDDQASVDTSETTRKRVLNEEISQEKTDVNTKTEFFSTKNMGENADFGAINRQTKAESILEEGFKALGGKTVSDPEIRKIARDLITQEKSRYNESLSALLIQ